MVHNTARLLSHHWDSLIFVPKAKSFLGTAFGTRKGATQEDPTSSVIFNIMVEAVLR